MSTTFARWAVVGACCVALSAGAATRTWSGAVSVYWSNGANWQEGAAPINGDRVVFPAGPASTVNSYNDLTLLALDSIEVDSIVSLTGNSLELSSGVPITVSSDATLNVPISLHFDPVFSMQSGAALTLGPLRVLGGTLRVNSPGASIYFAGGIQQTSTVGLNITAQSVQIGDNLSTVSGPAVFNLSHQFEVSGDGIGVIAGGLTVTAQEFYVWAHGRVLQNSVTVNNAGVVFIRARQVNGTLTLAPSGSADLQSDEPLIVAGDVVTTGSLLIGSGSIPSYITLASHATTVNGLIIVEPNSTLAMGMATTLPFHANVQVVPAATLDLGIYPQIIAGFTCNGTLAVTSQGYLTVSAQPDLRGCSLQLTSSGGFTPAGFPLIVNGSGADPIGTFTGLPEGALVSLDGVDRVITYKGGAFGHDVVLNPAPTARLVVVAGDQQSLAIGDQSTTSMAVRAVDAANHALPNVVVHWTSTCATFAGATSVDATTDANGESRPSGLWKAGSVAGTCLVHAQAADGSGTSLDLTTHIYDPATMIVSPTPSSVSTMANQSFNITIHVADRNGNALPNMPVGHQLASTSGATATPGQGADTTDANRNATFTETGNGVAGAYQVMVASDPRGPTISIPVTQSVASTTPPSTTSPITLVENMWWVGTSENGWGMSLIQHDDRLFGAFYIYDAAGNPTWIIMSGGSWDSTHRIFTGPLYQPTGTPYYAYDTTRFQVGNQLGTVTITFQDSNNATLDYNYGVNSGHKVITREVFGASSITGTDHTDLWWGGDSQNGWGVTITQQGSTLFPIWFTYGTSGAPLWYFMTDGTWNSANDTYTGNMYRATGSPWIGATYDASKLVVTKAGTFTIVFTASGATFNYNADGHSGSIPLVREPF